MSDHWTGRLIDGRYTVEATLGQGGMGVVLRARHRFTNAQVALKMLRPDMQFDQSMQERFLAEARAPSAIGHPGIVAVLDAGKTPEGELYLVMELLAGRTLRQAMPLAPHEARRIALELLDALGAAHARGIVHRDLKPENVFLVGAGANVKLLDFGIAKVVESSAKMATAAGALLGTIAYMAPEQLHDASTVDARADLWAVGVMLYEMLSGQLPYHGTHISQLVHSLATRDPDPITAHIQAPPAVAAFFTRALARDRSQRFASAHELAGALAQLPLDGSAPAVMQHGPIGTGPLGTGPLGTGPLGTGPTVGANVGVPVGTMQSITPPPPTTPPPVYPAPYPTPTYPPPASPTPGTQPPAYPPPARSPADLPPSTQPRASAASPPARSAPGYPPAVRRLPAPPRSPGKRAPWLVIGIAGGGMLIVAIAIGVAIRPGADSSRNGPRDFEATTTCEATCAALARCELSGANCMDLCQENAMFKGCMQTPDCDVFSTCILGAACPGNAPRGTGTCEAAALCEAGCRRDDRACECTCVGNLAPEHAVALTRLNLCSAVFCQQAANVPACAEQLCARPLRACLSGRLDP